MKAKKLAALLLCAVIITPTFASCSKTQDTSLTTKNVVMVDDGDDGVDDNKSAEADDMTIDLKDKDGNTLTSVPVYNVDGATMIAVYIEAAKDKNGKALDQKQYPYIKQVVAIELDKLGEASLMYNDGKLVSLNALSDKDGYIIALQDTIDIDNDKDTKEYFKAVTKVDSLGNLFIKLDKGEDGKPVNVTVEKESNGKKKVTTSDGKTVDAQNTENSKNLQQVAEEKKETAAKKPSGSSGNNNNNNNNNDEKVPDKPNNPDKPNKPDKPDKPDKPSPTPEDPDEPKPEYISIVLLKGGKVSCNAKNVTVESGTLDTGSEVIINGAGECGKYYVTSETDVFLGHLDFRFSVDETVEVKFNDVNIDTKRKTAVKFTNVDKENNKESDTEETGKDQAGASQAIEAAAPKVNLSFTGNNKFKAHGVGTNGTIYSECRLDIKGHGTAEIDGGDNLSGICSTESIDIRNATLNITSRAKQGISCDRKVTIEYGTSIDIKSKGDGIHCNKFEMCNPSEFTDKEKATPASVKIQSLYTTECADGIDSNDYIIINGGTLDVTALSQNKYGLKVRKINNGKENGKFEINGGKVISSAIANTALTSCKQSTIALTAKKEQQLTAGSFTSAEGARSLVCSPCNVDTVTMISPKNKPTEYKVSWNGNIGTALSVR